MTALSSFRRRIPARLAVVLSAASCAALVAACSSGQGTPGTSSSAPSVAPGTSYYSTLPKFTKHVTLTWWNWNSDANGVIAAFEKAYPTIKIVHPTIGGGSDEYTKLTTALAAGSGAPDVVMIEYDRLPQFIAKKGLVNITNFLNPYKADFPSWAWNQVSSQGAVYAVPQDQAPMGLIYQPKLFAKYHLPVPQTYAQFASDAAALKKADPSEYMTWIPNNDGSYFASLVWQAGGQLFTQTGPTSWKVTLDTPVVQNVLNYWVNLIKAGEVVDGAYGAPSLGHQIATGQFASYVMASWYPAYGIDSYAAPNTQSFSVAQVPQWTANGSVNANYGGATNAVTTQSQNPEAAEIFATFVNLDTMNLAETSSTKGGGGYLPANVNASSAAAFNSPASNMAQPPFPQFWQYAKNISYNFQWSPFIQYFGSIYETELQNVVNGGEPVSTALSKMQSQMVSYVQSQGYTVSQ